MKKINKAEFLHELHLQAESHLTQAIQVFQNLDEQDLNRHPDGGGWSIAECLEHLNTYSRYYIPRLERGISGARKASPESFTRGWLGSYFQRMMDPDRASKTYKAASRHVPVPLKSGYEVVGEFIDFQERLSKVLIHMHMVDLNSFRIPTSLSPLIRLNAGDTVAFLITHDERHIRQANRLLRSPSSPEFYGDPFGAWKAS